jgi:hypothetical protein
LAELDVTATYVGPDIVDQVSRGPEYHRHRAMLASAPTQLARQQQCQQTDRDRHRQRHR